MTHDDDAALDQHLAGMERQAVADLARVLDIEAGLQEVLLDSRHHTAVEELAGALDIEAGLAAILPEPRGQRPAPAEGPEAAARQVIAGIPPVRRIALRAHPATRALIKAVLTHQAISAAHDHARELVEALNHASNHAPARELARARARELVEALNHASELDRSLKLACGQARDLELDIKGALDRTLDHARNQALDRAHARARARELDLGHALNQSHTTVRTCAEIFGSTSGGPYGLADVDHEALGRIMAEGVLDDVTDADLRRADLTHHDLTGLRWTLHGTRWPAEIDTDQLLARSQETAPGTSVYTITRGPNKNTIRETFLT